MNKEFNYVIARTWYEEGDRLCSYMIHGSDVHYGTIEDAQILLKYVIGQKEDEPKDYKIYKVVPYGDESC